MNFPRISAHPYLTGLVASAALAMPVIAQDGNISTDRDTVLPNSVVTVDWNATYPSAPTAPPVSKTPTGTLVTSKEVIVSVKVVGSGYGPSRSPYPVRSWVSTSGGSGWEEIFFGNADTLDPQEVVWTKVLAAGETLDFKFHGSESGNYDVNDFSTARHWKDPIDTTPTSLRPWNLAVLTDGESIRNYNPEFDQESLHSYLSAYFRPDSTTVQLGERDFIYMTELSKHNEGHQRTDMQDLVILVTYEEVDE